MSAVSVAIIPRSLAGSVVGQRSDNGYICASEMCRLANKRMSDYLALDSTIEFLAALSILPGIMGSILIETREGRYGGTWIHPRVAVHFGQWLSADFAIQVSEWVYDWMSGRQPPNTESTQIGAYIRRAVANADKVPIGHFSILGQVADLLVGPMEAHGYILPDNFWPDISVGLTFCEYLRTEGIDTDSFNTYPHKCPNGMTVPAKAYPDSMLPIARKWIIGVWLPTYGIAYFKKRHDVKALTVCDQMIDRHGLKRIAPGKEGTRNRLTKSA